MIDPDLEFDDALLPEESELSQLPDDLSIGGEPDEEPASDDLF